MEEDLSDLRHVRRELFDQLHRGYPGGCGSRMVHVLRDAAEPLLLVFRRHIGRDIRFLPAVQHGGAGLRHDGDVRRHLPGAVAQGERSRQLALRLAVSLLCLILFGADQFMVPAMLAILGVLTLLRRPLEKGEDEG